MRQERDGKPVEKKQLDGGSSKKKKGAKSRSLVWRESRPPDESEDWMMSYADAMTLLMTFFIIMFSLSEPNESRFDDLKQSLKAELRGEDSVSAVEEAIEVLQAQAENQGMADVISFVPDKSGIVITVSSDVLFATQTADLKPLAVSLLGPTVEQVLSENWEAFKIEVQGHTDNTPINTPRYPSNWELTAAQSTNVVRYLVYSGVAQDRLEAIAFADTRPARPNMDILDRPIPENMRANRRIVIKIKR